MKLFFVFIICITVCACKNSNYNTKIINPPLKDSATIIHEYLEQDLLNTVHETNRVYKLIPHNTYLIYKEISRDTTSSRTDTTTLQTDALGLYEINVPKSHRFEIAFSDGFKVWLNAKSKFRFRHNSTDSVFFEIYGEAYFINKKAATIVSPGIRVNTKADSKVNVRCYENEPSKISLLKGIAYVNSSRLKASECAYVNGQTKIISGCCKDDLDDPISWTKGLLSFENKNCREAFNELNRWYRVIEYKGSEKCDVSGHLPLSLNMKDLLYFLKFNRYTISYQLNPTFGIIIK